LYDQFPDAEKLSDMCNLGLREYNELNPVMDLVLFEDAMKHICKVTRIITASGGHALLVGFGGSGKQSLTKLATFTACYELFTISLVRGYKEADFREDLRGLYKLVLGKA
jgi:dynein heavy chain